jgi:RimJ/RimL family protein N-acetyltransferase
LQAFGLERILGVTAAANTASKRSLERAGFVFERDMSMSFQGAVQAVSVYALSRPSSRGDA